MPSAASGILGCNIILKALCGEDVKENRESVCVKQSLGNLFIQPVVRLLVNDSNCVRIKSGQTVSFEAYAEVPCDGGKITAIDFSFEGEKDYPIKGNFQPLNGGSAAVACVEFTYNKPGTYFAIASQVQLIRGCRRHFHADIQP